ncbi:MAG: protein kinase [Candidatus Riflebacteria bacterium]|nr:protein kinase [Candidatus Riflebacteria bacterium]
MHGLARAATADETRLTQQGQVVGTYSYMAPEQMEGKEAGPAADLYALGLMAYELVVRRPVFSAAATAPAVTPPMRFMGIIPDLAEAAPDAPRSVTGLITRCIARDPSQRSVTAPELIAKLEELSPEQLGRRPGSVVRPLRGGVRRDLEATKTFPPPASSPKATRPTGVVLVLAGAALGVLGAVAWRGLGRPVPAASATPTGRPSTASARPRLEVRGRELFLEVEAGETMTGAVRWREGDAARERRFGPARRPSIAVGGPALRTVQQVEVVLDGLGRVDLTRPIEERVAVLESRLARLKMETLVRRAAFLVGRKVQPDRIAREVRALLPPGLADEVEALGALCRGWIAVTGDRVLQRRMLAGIYRMEVLNSYLARQGVGEATSVSDLLPETWRERHYAYGVKDSPRFIERHGRDRREPRMRFQGRTTDARVAWGPGFVRQEHWLGVSGGQPRNVAENLLPDREDQRGAPGSAEWVLEFRLTPTEVTSSRELLLDLYMGDPGDGVVWTDVNGRLDVPFSRAIDRRGPQTHDRYRLTIRGAGLTTPAGCGDVQRPAAVHIQARVPRFETPEHQPRANVPEAEARPEEPKALPVAKARRCLCVIGTPGRIQKSPDRGGLGGLVGSFGRARTSSSASLTG